MRIAPLILAAAVLAGCAARSSDFAPVENALRGGDYELALSELDKKKSGENDLLVYELNRASALQAAGRHKESLESFENAKNLVSEFDSLSVSEQAASLIMNDATIAYYGEDYERAYIHFYAAIAYLAMGDLDGARVEAMQSDARMALFRGAYGEDAAIRFLNGVIFDSIGDGSDALVSFRKSYRSYKDGFFGVAPPSYLKSDLLRLSKHFGSADEYQRYLREFGASYDKAGGGGGEFVAIVSAGFAPIKRSDRVMFPSPYGSVVIALPRYERRPVSDPLCAVDGNLTSLSLISNIAAIAESALSERMSEITARAVARAAAKKALEYAAEQAGNSASGGKQGSGAGGLARLVTQIVNIATEVADTRSWLTLPDKIYFVRGRLPNGKHKMTINGSTFEFEIKNGGRTFIAPRVF